MSITKPDQIAFGKITKMEYVTVNDIQSILIIENGATITLKTGKVWEEIYYTHETAKHKQPVSSGVHGDSYEQSVSFFVPSNRKTITWDMLSKSKPPCVVRITYSSGIILLVGKIEEPVKLISNPQNDTSDGYDCLFTGTTTAPALFL